MFVRVELEQATVDYQVADLKEADRVIRAITGNGWYWMAGEFARFAYDGGRRLGVVRRKDFLRAGVLLNEDEAAREA